MNPRVFKHFMIHLAFTALSVLFMIRSLLYPWDMFTLLRVIGEDSMELRFDVTSDVCYLAQLDALL